MISKQSCDKAKEIIMIIQEKIHSIKFYELYYFKFNEINCQELWNCYQLYFMKIINAFPMNVFNDEHTEIFFTLELNKMSVNANGNLRDELQKLDSYFNRMNKILSV